MPKVYLVMSEVQKRPMDEDGINLILRNVYGMLWCLILARPHSWEWNIIVIGVMLHNGPLNIVV